jgi:dUTP pyrophosphatase
LDDRFFSSIDTEEKAYLLGWIASDGHIARSGSITLEIHKTDAYHLGQLRDLIWPELPIFEHNNLVGFRLSSRQMVSDVCRWLSIGPGKKSALVRFPPLSSVELGWAFLRGFFEGDGHVTSISSKKRQPQCHISTNSAEMRRAIREFCKIPCREYSDRLEWYGNNALDFLARLYIGTRPSLLRKRERYIEWCGWVPGLSTPGCRGRNMLFRWLKTDHRAVPPYKERASDSGYDLTLIDKVREWGPIELYTTGIRITPEYGWYFDLVARSSIVKTGYAVANSIGVIDRTYQGPIMAPLVKIDPDAPDLSLPCRVVQIVPRPIIHIHWVEVDSLDETARADDGFGSTG